MKAFVKDGQLILVMPLQSPTPSSTGKTLIVANSRGYQKTEAQVDGATVSVSVTALIKKTAK